MDGNFIWGIIVGVLIISTVSNNNSKLQKEIARTNLTLDKIAKHMGIPDTPAINIDDELKMLIADGKKIEAVKRYRMVTGYGLKESKEYVDSLTNQQK